MSIRNAGAAIKEARIRACLTREKMSDGICSAKSLYRIETNATGVSPATFQALMARAGASCEILPIFANRTDFDCFLALKHTRLHLDAWQLNSAYEELQKIENIHWANNKYYYQEWLLHHCRLQFRSGCCNHQLIYSTLTDALLITQPQFDINMISHMLLSLNEINLFVLLAQEHLYLNHQEECDTICMQLTQYLENAQITHIERCRLLATNAIVYIKHLIADHDYCTALELCQKHHHQMVVNADNSCLLELCFLTGLCYYYLNDTAQAMNYIRTAIICASSIKSCYSSVCYEYVTKHTSLSFSDRFVAEFILPFTNYEMPSDIDSSGLSDGTFDLSSPDVLTLGRLIRDMRTEQKISQSSLCFGLCSKSKLSKIENDILQPGMLLAETLLQRLGISEREFTFWGNSNEAEFHELKFQLLYNKDLSAENMKNILLQLKSITLPDTVLAQQYIEFQSAFFESSTDKIIDALHNALQLTLPNIDTNRLCQYRLSWTEISILNNLAYQYRFTKTPYVGINLFYRILEYYTNIPMDIMLIYNTMPISLFRMLECLYTNKHYQEAVDLFSTDWQKILKYTFTWSGPFYFYYSQALGEENNMPKALAYGIYSYNIEKLNERITNSQILENALLRDFNLRINYWPT